jgi:Bacterial regulatory proteins, lacI family
MGHRSGATIYDVARVAGVATSTVSRALSNPGRVSFKTAEHVRKVAKELGYRSEIFEREVPDKRTKILAMIVADINNPVFHGSGRRRTSTSGCKRESRREGPHSGFEERRGEEQRESLGHCGVREYGVT